MASQCKKATRKNVLTAIKSGQISGVNLEQCARNIVGQLELQPCSVNKVLQLLKELQRDQLIQLADAQLQALSPDEVRQRQHTQAYAAERAAKAVRVSNRRKRARRDKARLRQSQLGQLADATA